MHDPVRLLAILLVYAAIFLVAWYDKKKLDTAERRTFWFLYLFYAVTIFIVNYLGYLVGIFSFLPWLNSFLHTFVWIGIVLSYLFVAIYKEPIAVQFLAFAFLSLAVRYSEYKLFGVWNHDHFLYLFRGTDAYILGWSFVDGFYSVATFPLLKLVSRKIPGLVPAR